MENSMENPWEIHGKSMDNKNGKKAMFPWYSMGPLWGPWGPMGPHEESWVPMGSHGSPWVPMGPHGVPMGSHGFPWVPMGPHGSHGTPWVPMGSPWGPHGSPWVPMGSPWVPMGPMGSHGVPMASMENPRMSEIMNFNEYHYSVRQKIGEPGSKSIRNMFPLHPVTSKRPESPYGAKYLFLTENLVFQFFGLLIPYRGPIEAL